MLERIVYVSAAREEQTDPSVDRILEISQARNAASAITGLLVGGGCWWIQVLEGSADSLEPVWQSIRKDPRHDPVVLVQRRPLRRREFAEWSMRFRKTADDRFVATLSELVGEIADPRLRQQIVRFSETFLQPPGKPWIDAA